MVRILTTPALAGEHLVARVEEIADTACAALFAPQLPPISGETFGSLLDRLRRPLKGFDLREGRLIQAALALAAQAHAPQALVLSSYRVSATDSDAALAETNRHLRDFSGIAPPRPGQEAFWGEIDVLIADPVARYIAFVDVKRSARPEDGDTRRFMATTLAVRRRLQHEGIDCSRPANVILRWFANGVSPPHVTTRENADDRLGFPVRATIDAAVARYRRGVELNLRRLLDDCQGPPPVSETKELRDADCDEPPVVSLDAFRRALGLDQAMGGRAR